MTSKLLLLSLLVCLVAADVSEILRKSTPNARSSRLGIAGIPVVARQQHKLQARNAEHDLTDAVEVLTLDLDDVQPEFQLTGDHQDYEGPYHYVAPVEAEVDNDYLPPFVAGENLAKRHAKLRLRK